MPVDYWGEAELRHQMDMPTMVKLMHGWAHSRRPFGNFLAHRKRGNGVKDKVHKPRNDRPSIQDPERRKRHWATLGRRWSRSPAVVTSPLGPRPEPDREEGVPAGVPVDWRVADPGSVHRGDRSRVVDLEKGERGPRRVVNHELGHGEDRGDHTRASNALMKAMRKPPILSFGMISWTGSVVLKGQNPFGEVTSGWLSTRAFLRPVKVKYNFHHGKMDQNRFRFDLGVPHERLGFVQYPFYADYVLSEPGPHHVPNDSPVWLLCILSEVFIVLQEVGPQQDQYRRIGIFRPPNAVLRVSGDLLGYGNDWVEKHVNNV